MANQKIKVAEIIGKWVGGGVEQVVYNYCSRLNKEKFDIEFLIDEDSLFVPRKELEKAGIKFRIIPPYQKTVKYQKELIRLFKSEKYDIVHSHLNALSVFPLRAAKKAKIKVRIAHSHSTTNKKEIKKNLLKQFLRPLAKIYATNYFCCTEHAGRWLFGDRVFDNGNVYVMNNAIDVEKFKFNEDIRKQKRKELNIDESTFVVGHCGRFVEQKNHRFLIDVFNELCKNREDAVLLLIGQGPLQNEIKEKVAELGLVKNVKFLGQRNDINEMYQVFDIFVLPSLYEGLGMVLVEAQCSGCTCVASNEVPDAAKVSNKLFFCDLNDSKEVWAKIININRSQNREDLTEEVCKKGYDIRKETLMLEKKYMDLIGD